MDIKFSRKRATVYRNRQKSFFLGQSINDMVIPQYNALRDPYLAGFFNNPSTHAVLRKTGVIRKKKTFSLQRHKQEIADPKLILYSEGHLKHKKSKSLSKKGETDRLPHLEEHIDGRLWLKSEEKARPKYINKSVKLNKEV